MFSINTNFQLLNKQVVNLQRTHTNSKGYFVPKTQVNPICAEIFSHPIGAGGGSRMTPPLISGHSGHKGTN